RPWCAQTNQLRGDRDAPGEVEDRPGRRMPDLPATLLASAAPVAGNAAGTRESVGASWRGCERGSDRGRRNDGDRPVLAVDRVSAGGGRTAGGPGRTG